jgi:hypothetical protein
MHPRGRRVGMTLTEIMLSVGILAVAFIPIIGVMGNSIKGTQKDDRIIRAVNLAQTKLNIAMQFPFNELANNWGGGGAGPWSFPNATSTYSSPNGQLSLVLGSITDEGTIFSVSLQITNVPVQFRLQTYNPASFTLDRRLSTPNPNNWGWSAVRNLPTSPLTGVYQRMVLTVNWTEPGVGQRFYSLVTFKGDLEE